MSTYKGNVGNLMQHWTLCELLTIAGRHTSGLSFIDAHAMAPLAHKRGRGDPTFSRVQECLPSQESEYEKAWQSLVPQGQAYPNSTAFLEEIWDGDFSLLLCEIDPSTLSELRTWIKHVRTLDRCMSAEIFPRDWRKRFGKGLPSVSELGLTDESLTLVSFDPYMYNRRCEVKRPNKGNLYPEDLKLVLDAMSNLEGGVLIQLSTYDTNDNNPQGSVISSIDSIMATSDFALCGVVPANKKMMSLIFARNALWSDELSSLCARFKKWRSGIQFP